MYTTTPQCTDDLSRGSAEPLIQRQPRACANCAAAKAKCIPKRRQANLAGCERCSRMELQCVPQPPVLRKRREGKAIRVGKLEQKVDTIVSFLSHAQPALPSLAQQPLPPFTQPFQPTLQSKDVSETALPRTILPLPIPSQPKSHNWFPTPHSPGLSGSKTLLDLGLSRSEEENRLHVFRQMAEFFPFVVIPTSTSAHDLCHDKPFLFATIMVAASNGRISYKKEIGQKLMEYLSVHLILNGERSLDLLQGTLVYITWCNQRYQFNPQISNYIQLAISMVVELAINRPPVTNSKQWYLINATDVEPCERPSIPDIHPTEAMRAYLGCYYLSTIISSLFKKLDAMPATPYLEKCWKYLEEANEFPTDKSLVHLIHLQHSIQKIAQVLPAERLEALWDTNTPVMMFVEALAVQLRSTRDLLPLDLQKDARLLVHYHQIEIFLYETGLCEPLQTTNSNSLFPRIKILHSCLGSTKSFLDALFLIPPEQYSSMSFVTWSQLSHVLKVIGRLHLIKLDGWDNAYVRSTINFATVVEKLAVQFEAAGKYGDSQEEENLFLQYTRMMKWSLSSYNQRLNTETASTTTVAVQPDQQTEDIPHAIDDQILDYASLEDLFWQEFIGEWGGSI